MLVFSSKDAAHLRYRADFSQAGYANISFFDAARRQILFHVSLRAEEGLAVCNKRGLDKNDWAHEISCPLPRHSGGVDVEIRFDLPRVTVLANGVPLFRFGRKLSAPLGRSPFPDLGKIAFVDMQGGISIATMDMDDAAARTLPLHLTSRLELRGHLPRAVADLDPAAPLQLHSDGLEMPPAVIPIPRPDGTLSLRCVLPGRFWQNLAAGQSRKLELRSGKNVLAALSLGRDDLLGHVSQTLALAEAGGDLGGDLFLITQLLEHVQFAGLMPDLDPAGRARLANLSSFLGMEIPQTLRDPDGPAAPPPACHEVLEQQAAAQQMAHALVQVAKDLRDGTPDAALRHMRPPEGSDHALFYAALAEPFCESDSFDALFIEAAQHLDIPTQMTPRDHPWFNSGLLPYLLRAECIEALHETFGELAAQTGDWIMTPPLAWTVRAALDNPRLPDTDRDRLITSFLDFLEARQNDYWERTPCLQLIATGVALVAFGPRLEDDLRHRVEGALLQSFGLMPAFWSGTDSAGISLPPRLAAAREGFALLRDPDTSQAAKAAALGLFERAGCPDTMRLRRDLFGPGALPDGRDPIPRHLLQEGLDPSEPALRHLAAPESPEGTPQMLAAARAGFADSYAAIPQSPWQDLHLRVGHQATAVLAQARGGADPAAACAALLPDLIALSHGSVRWVGVGLALKLLGGLMEARAQEAADVMLRQLKQTLKRDKSLLAALSKAPPVAMALWALNQGEATRGILPDLGLTPPALPRAAPAALQQIIPQNGIDPLLDTVVVVFSCRAHLDTRIPQMRAGWLAGLADRGIPYLIVVGDGDNTLERDILRLDAPDTYEGLPQKTLATVAWVHDHTTFTHMLKIDDDCFLNVPAYFEGFSHLKADYYGRILTRVQGQMDRAWHRAKSTSVRGRLEYDKSPEPSTYCDGGSGYAFSRTAMAALLDAAASPNGRALIQVSFMEDKLVGDLLALRDITPANEDYHITVRRRETPQGRPIPRWVNGFDASTTAPVKVVHLDDPDAQGGALLRAGRPGLWPKKIWPSYQPARLGEQSNALELVSDRGKLHTARDAPVAVVATMRNEMFMLPHFLAHYRRLGVDCFLIADNCSDDGTFEYLADQSDVVLFTVDTDYRNSHYGVAWQQALISHFRTNRWSLVADADELLVWQDPQAQSLPELLRSPDFEDADAARVFMLDLYPRNQLATADFKSGDPFGEAGFTDRAPFLQISYGRGPYSNAPTWTSAVRHRLIAGSRSELFVAQKIALLKYSPFMRLSAGLHYVAGARLAPRDLLFGHFKYNAAFAHKARTEVMRQQHFNNAEEYAKYLALLAEGRDVIYDEAVSVPWASCDFVRDRLG